MIVDESAVTVDARLRRQLAVSTSSDINVVTSGGMSTYVPSTNDNSLTVDGQTISDSTPNSFAALHALATLLLLLGLLLV